MDSLYQSGINGKLYRLWYEINRSSSIQVKTGVGLTENKRTDGNVAQGTLGSALLSTLNLSTGIQNFFRSSMHEVSYSDI